MDHAQLPQRTHRRIPDIRGREVTVRGGILIRLPGRIFDGLVIADDDFNRGFIQFRLPSGGVRDILVHESVPPGGIEGSCRKINFHRKHTIIVRIRIRRGGGFVTVVFDPGDVAERPPVAGILIVTITLEILFHVQILARIARLHAGKIDLLILDIHGERAGSSGIDIDKTGILAARLIALDILEQGNFRGGVTLIPADKVDTDLLRRSSDTLLFGQCHALNFEVKRLHRETHMRELDTRGVFPGDDVGNHSILVAGQLDRGIRKREVQVIHGITRFPETRGEHDLPDVGNRRLFRAGRKFDWERFFRGHRRLLLRGGLGRLVCDLDLRFHFQIECEPGSREIHVERIRIRRGLLVNADEFRREIGVHVRLDFHAGGGGCVLHGRIDVETECELVDVRSFFIARILRPSG